MKHTEVQTMISEQKDLSKELQEKLHAVAKDFVAKFKVTSK